MSKVIGIIAIKGGVGKTTLSASLASDLVNHYGKKVLLVDANYSAPNLGLHMDIVKPEKTIHEVLDGKAKIQSAIHNKYGVDVIPGSYVYNKQIPMLKLKDRIKAIKSNYDFVIIDSAAGLGKESLSALESCDEALIVLNPELPSVTDALKSIRVAQELGKEITGVIVNRKRDRYCMTIQEIESMLEFPIIGTIPEDEIIKKAQVERDLVVSLYPDSEVSKSYEKISSYLLGENYQEKEESVWNIFKGLMGLK